MIRTLFCLASVALCGGCAYKLGPTNGYAASERSVQIAPPVNSTTEPRVGEAVSHALRKQIQHDGTYRLDTKGNADVIVSTKITDYHRRGVTFQPNDTLRVRDYQVRILAHVTAYDRVTGKNLFDREFQGHTTVRVGNDQASAERQALPLLADDLARHITSALADGEW